MKRFYCAHWTLWVVIFIVAIISIVLDLLIIIDTQSNLSLIASLTVESVVLGYFFYYAFFRKVYIGVDGIMFKTPFVKFHLKWAQIKEIGIGEASKVRGNTIPKIYFSASKVSPHFLHSYKIGNEIIIVDYKDSIIRETRKYWKYSISGVAGTKINDRNNIYPPYNE